MANQDKLKVESDIRQLFNRLEHLHAYKAKLSFKDGKPPHEFDILDEGKVIGGISTSPWKNKTGSNNSGGQDRVAAELLWLTLWPGKERRVMILSNKEMAEWIWRRWEGCSFPYNIEIIYCDLMKKEFETIGLLMV